MSGLPVIVIWCCGIALGCLFVALSGLYSGSETGLYCANRLRFKLWASRGDAKAKRLHALLESEQDALSTLLIGTNVANYLATVTVAYLLTHAANVGAEMSEIYTTLIVTPIVFVFGEVVPKNLFQRSADRLMYAGGAFFWYSSRLFRWPVWAVNALSKPLLMLVNQGSTDSPADPRANVALLLREAVAAEDEVGEHSALIDRVLRLSSLALHQVMTPRNRVVAIRGDADRQALRSAARRDLHSRFPVYENNPRRIVGLINIHKLLADDVWYRIIERVEPVASFHAHDSVASAILRLQASRATMAVVLDRNGLLLGLVTLKDLLEELTGELSDW